MIWLKRRVIFMVYKYPNIINILNCEPLHSQAFIKIWYLEVDNDFFLNDKNVM